jgi:DNA-binding CsgD family transcriptional regulator
MRNALTDKIELIYRAVEEPALWRDVLSALIAASGASTGALTTFDPGNTCAKFIADRGFSDSARELYDAYYYRVDPFQPMWLEPRTGTMLGQDFVTAAEFERSEMWNDYARVHLDAFYLLGASLALQDGHIAAFGLQRPRAAEPFGVAEQQSLNVLLPHLQGALRLRQRLNQAGGTGEGVGFAVLHALELGIVVVREDGGVVFANYAALASPALVIGLRRGPFSVTDPVGGRTLHALVRAAATGGPGGGIVLHPPGHAAVAALVAPVLPGLADEARSRDLALVVLRPLAPERAAIEERLRQLFRLTPAEAALALALLAGQRPEEIAAAREVKISTVRFQLRAILDKTGTRGQSDLVRLLGRLMPFRGDGEAIERWGEKQN